MGDSFVYDRFDGPDLDAALWAPAPIELPSDDNRPLIDPLAKRTVGAGEVRVTIPRFSLSHNTVQVADSIKYLFVSTRHFELPPDRSVTFAVDLAVNNIGGEPCDFRQGMAALHVGDPVSARAYAVCGTSTRVLAMHEQLSRDEDTEPFIHVTESPYDDFNDDFTRFRTCEITLDRHRSTATWCVDGTTVYEVRSTALPERALIGFGIWTMLPIRDGRSRSVAGQGLDARWRRFRISGLDATTVHGAPPQDVRQGTAPRHDRTDRSEPVVARPPHISDSAPNTLAKGARHLA
jgi:hypothetical protein